MNISALASTSGLSLLELLSSSTLQTLLLSSGSGLGGEGGSWRFLGGGVCSDGGIAGWRGGVCGDGGIAGCRGGEGVGVAEVCCDGGIGGWWRGGICSDGGIDVWRDGGGVGVTEVCCDGGIGLRSGSVCDDGGIGGWHGGGGVGVTEVCCDGGIGGWHGGGEEGVTEVCRDGGIVGWRGGVCRDGGIGGWRGGEGVEVTEVSIGSSLGCKLASWGCGSGYRILGSSLLRKPQKMAKRTRARQKVCMPFSHRSLLIIVEVKEITEGMTMKVMKMVMSNKDVRTPALRWGGDEWLWGQLVVCKDGGAIEVRKESVKEKMIDRFIHS